MPPRTHEREVVLATDIMVQRKVMALLTCGSRCAQYNAVSYLASAQPTSSKSKTQQWASHICCALLLITTLRARHTHWTSNWPAGKCPLRWGSVFRERLGKRCEEVWLILGKRCVGV